MPESISVPAPTEATAVFCVFDAGTVLGPMGPDGLPTVVNDEVLSLRNEYRLFLEDGLASGRTAGTRATGRGKSVPTGRLVLLAFATLVILTGESTLPNGWSNTAASTGGQAQISTWVIGAINGGVSKPTGTSSCSAWALVDGSNFGSVGLGEPTVQSGHG